MSGDFEADYWEANYSQPHCMDGIGNAKEHARYLKSFCEVESVEIDSIVDFGCGLGYQFQEILYLFSPSRALGIEPSMHVQSELRKRDLDPYNRIDVDLRQQGIESWCVGKEEDFDLGICMSVLQYLDDAAIEACMPIIASRVQYLYLTVPTDVELQRQIDECHFKDEWAIHRSRERYKELLSPSFTFISSRILESKALFDEVSSSFTDLLFRF